VHVVVSLPLGTESCTALMGRGTCPGEAFIGDADDPGDVDACISITWA
jgi:hypothetical protein